MKQHHTAFWIGVALLVAAFVAKDQRFVGWWMVGGLLFLSLSFLMFMNRR